MPEDDRSPDLDHAESSPWIPVVLAVVVLGATCLLVSRCHQPPAALGLDAPAEVFSAERASQRLERLLGDETPHPLGTTANDEVRTRLLAELEGLGLQPVVNSHWVPRAGRWSSSLVLAHNVLAELPSSQPDLPAIMLACHYDSVPAGPGASDDGAGMAAMLEVTRILQANAPLPRPVILLFTDGEEIGLFGARGFASFNPIADRVGMIVNLEARGTSGGSLMFETSKNNRWMIGQAARGLSRPMSSSAYVEIYRLMPNSSDMNVFLRRELAGMNFAFIGSPKHYHTPLDNLDHLDKRSLQHHGNNALGMVRQLLSADWESADQARGDAVYTDLFARWIIAWPASWGPWISGILLATAALCTRVLHERFQWRVPQILGAATCWLVIILAGALASFLGAWLLKLAGASSTPFPADMHFDVMVHCLGGGIGIVLSLVLLRPVPLLFFLVNAVALALCAMVLALTFTGFSYLLLLPAAVGAMASLTFLKFPANKPILTTACVVLSVLTAVIGFPFLARLPEALGVVFAAPAVGVVVALLLLPIIPLLGDLTRRLLLCSALALTFVAALVFILALKTPAFNADSPQQITLSFLEQVGKEQAQLSISSWEAPIPTTLAESMPALESPNPLLSIPGLPVSVPPAGRPAPKLDLLNWTTAGDLHTVRLRLTRSLPSQQILAGISDSLAVERISAQETELPVPPGSTDNRIWLHFRGVPENGIAVTLSWRGPPRLDLVLVGSTPGLPPHLSHLAKLRDSLPACTAHMGDESMVLTELLLEAPQPRAN